MFAVLNRFGFPLKFIKLIKILNKSPTSKLKVKDIFFLRSHYLEGLNKDACFLIFVWNT